MESGFLGKAVVGAVILLCVWLAVRYLLPVLLPFLLGGLLALAAEPAVRLGVGKLHLRRGPAAGAGVSLTLVLLLCIVSFAGAFAVRELAVVVDAAPDIGQTVRQGMLLLQDQLISLADKTPESIRPLLTRTVLDTLNDGTALIDQVTSRLPGLVTSAIGWVSEGALTVGTGIVAAFMISARLPRLKLAVQKRLPEKWKETYLPALKRTRHALGGWLKAQLKLMGITALILTVGFLLLRIHLAPLWAALIALVDAVPVLGTGTVLVPWALVCFLQGNVLQGVGLLATYGCTAIARAVLEPRLLGRHLGLDPLLTLAAFYTGYRLWGFGGMVLAPILTAAITSATKQTA